jgi:hypothetical protein
MPFKSSFPPHASMTFRQESVSINRSLHPLPEPAAGEGVTESRHETDQDEREADGKKLWAVPRRSSGNPKINSHEECGQERKNQPERGGGDELQQGVVENPPTLREADYDAAQRADQRNGRLGEAEPGRGNPDREKDNKTSGKRSAGDVRGEPKTGPFFDERRVDPELDQSDQKE